MPRIVKIVGRVNDDGSYDRAVTVQQDDGKLTVTRFKYPSVPSKSQRRSDESVALGLPF